MGQCPCLPHTAQNQNQPWAALGSGAAPGAEWEGKAAGEAGGLSAQPSSEPSTAWAPHIPLGNVKVLPWQDLPFPAALAHPRVATVHLGPPRWIKGPFDPFDHEPLSSM